MLCTKFQVHSSVHQLEWVLLANKVFQTLGFCLISDGFSLLLRDMGPRLRLYCHTTGCLFRQLEDFPLLRRPTKIERGWNKLSFSYYLYFWLRHAGWVRNDTWRIYPVNISGSIRGTDRVVVLWWRVRFRRMLMQYACLWVLQNIHRELSQCYRSCFYWDYVLSDSYVAMQFVSVYKLPLCYCVFAIVSVEGPCRKSDDIEPSQNTTKHRTVHTAWDALHIFHIHWYLMRYLQHEYVFLYIISSYNLER